MMDAERNRGGAPMLVVLGSMLGFLGCGSDTNKPSQTAATCPSCAMVAGPSSAQPSVSSAGSGAPATSAGTAGMGAAPTTQGTPAVTGTSGAGTAGAGAAGTTPPGQPVMTQPPPAGSSGCGAATWPPSGTNMIDVGSMKRTYIVAIPSSYDPHKPYKLVFAWHGLGGSAQQVAGAGNFGYYGLQAQAGDSTIFVAGQGLDTGVTIGANGMPTGAAGMGSMPAAGSTAGWQNTNDQDIAFTRAMVDALRASYCIDDTRIFSVGMSYGGIMSNTVGCELGGIFRAIAPMSGSGPYQGRGGAACMGQVAVWMAHGNMDMTVPFASGQASRDSWVKANHCTSTTMPVDPSACVTYQGCDAGFPVTWCEFSGGHTIWQPSIKAIWTFFSQF